MKKELNEKIINMLDEFSVEVYNAYLQLSEKDDDVFKSLNDLHVQITATKVIAKAAKIDITYPCWKRYKNVYGHKTIMFISEFRGILVESSMDYEQDRIGKEYEWVSSENKIWETVTPEFKSPNKTI
jgi:hypothetical protein